MVLPAWRPVGETLAAKAIIVKDLRHVDLKSEVHGDTDRIVKGLNRVVPRVKGPKLVDRKVKGLNRVVPRVKDPKLVDRKAKGLNRVVPRVKAPKLVDRKVKGLNRVVPRVKDHDTVRVPPNSNGVVALQAMHEDGVTEKVIVLQKCDNAKVTEGRGQVIADQAVDRGHAPKAMTVMWNVARIETMTK